MNRSKSAGGHKSFATVLATALIITSLACLVNSARAQSQPADPRIRDMERTLAELRDQQNRGGYGDRFDDLRNQRYSNDFPAAEVNAAVDARARYAAARGMYDQAESALNRAMVEMQLAFENSADYKDAMAAELKAYDDLQTARAAVIEKVALDPRYQASAKLRDEFAQRIYAQWAERPLPMDQIVAGSTVKLGYATVVTSMNIAAEQNDPGVQQARNRLIAAGKRLHDLQTTFENRVRTDPGLIAARQKLEEARINRAIASCVFEGAVEVGNEALDYQYFRHRYDYRRPYYTDYGLYGYPPPLYPISVYPVAPKSRFSPYSQY